MANMFPQVFLLWSLYFGHNSMITASDSRESLYVVFDPQSMQPQEVCSTPKGYPQKSNTTRLTIADRHGPCSPIAENTERTLTLAEILEKDRRRLDHLYATMSSKNHTQNEESKTKVPLQPGSIMGTGNYVVTIRLGTPPRLQTLELDTGSDTSWVQCSACTSCYPQKEPRFNPMQSPSFQTMSCQSPSCDLFKGRGQCAPGNACVYIVKYGDGSLTTGIVGQDILTLGRRDVFSGFAFGCGLVNEGLFSGTAGLVGMGRGPTSLISQTARTYNSLFSYCFPKTSGTTGFLNLGFPSSFSMSYTPMLQIQDGPSFYGLSLVGINVYGQPVPIDQSTLSSVPAIIDSGTVITRLPPDVYTALRTTFVKYMSNYTQAPAVGILDTCFDFSNVTGGSVRIPTIELKFAQGASLKLGLDGMMIPMGNKPGIFCLAFATDTRFLLIGNIQQRGYEVVYDLYRRRIGFRPAAC